MTFTLTIGGNSVELPNPVFGNSDPPRRMQNARESVGGTFYVYDRGTEVQELTVTFDLHSKTEKDNLLAFLRTHAVWMKNTMDLEYDDWVPTEFGGSGGTVTLSGWRLATPTVEPREVRNGRYRVTLVFRSN